MKNAIIYGLLGLGIVGGGAWFLSQSSTPPATESNSKNSESVCKYSCISPDRDCSDFSSHREAQDFFECCGFTTTDDPMKLDSLGTGDGVACESLP